MAIRIMLVDDSSICNVLLKKVLSRLPVDTDIHEFTDPVLAFSQLDRLNPAIVFLDLNMPVLDGWGFLERMKETAKTNRVIILTSSTSDLDRARCADFANVLAYHTKPLTQDMVNAVLQAFQAESLG